MPTKTHEKIYKSFPVKVLRVNDAEGTVEAVVSVLGIVDDGDDIIHPGAYTKTLSERGQRARVTVLDQHNTSSVRNVVGRPLDIREIGRDDLPEDIRAEYPDAAGGLYTHTQFALDTVAGRETFALIAGGFVREYSIGFEIMQADVSKITDREGKPRTVRNIRAVRLWEYSPVIWGMNPATATLDAKQQPDHKEWLPDGTPQPRLGDVLAAKMYSALSGYIGSLLSNGMLDFNEHLHLTTAISSALSTLVASLPEDIRHRPVENHSFFDLLFFADEGAPEAKRLTVRSLQNAPASTPETSTPAAPQANPARTDKLRQDLAAALQQLK